METDLNAIAATRMFIERVRLAPLCFSAQYLCEMWSVDKILKVGEIRITTFLVCLISLSMTTRCHQSLFNYLPMTP